MIITNINNANKMKIWIKERKGIAVWNSVNLSNPTGQWLSPAYTDNKPTNKPNWQASNTPEVITEENQVKLITRKELKRLKIALNRSSNGLMLKLTDHSSKRVKMALELYEDSWHEFDYETQEAIIYVPDKEILLSEWKG